MIGMRLVTYQTGPEGQVVERVLVEQGLAIKRELYLGIVLDRASEKPVLMVSQDGGVEIEKVAARNARADLQGVHPPRRRACGRTRRASSRSPSGCKGRRSRRPAS